jgi:conjugal transfer pilus assembly protein TraI
MMETINGHPSAENLIHDLVIRSDQVSVERDLRNLGVAFTGYEIGLPVETVPGGHHAQTCPGWNLGNQ